MIRGGTIQKGFFLKIENEIFEVTDREHVKPGKGGAFIKCVLQNTDKDQKKDVRFRTDEWVEKVEFYEHQGSFVGKQKNGYMFIDLETLNDINIEYVPNIEFLSEGDDVTLLLVEDAVKQIKLPEKITCKVKHTNPYIKGQSATSQMKDAELANGVIIKVPQYIEAGEEIIIKIENREFVSRK